MSSDSRSTDPDASRYDEHWRPVLEGATRALLDRLDAAVESRLARAGLPPRLLDLGCGTGSLLLTAAVRWPALDLVGLDASAAMLDLARRLVPSSPVGSVPGSIEWHVSDAASMPLDDASVDLVASSFMLQLVPDRAVVLTEIGRVLAPGGTFGFVTWLAEDVMLGADEAFDEAVYELELDDPDGGFREAKAGDFESVEAARDELEQAGFSGIDARAAQLERAWTRPSFMRFKREYDERELFESLAADDRERLESRVMERWLALPDEAFILRAPLVSVVATRP